MDVEGRLVIAYRSPRGAWALDHVADPVPVLGSTDGGFVTDIAHGGVDDTTSSCTESSTGDDRARGDRRAGSPRLHPEYRMIIGSLATSVPAVPRNTW